MMPCNDTGIHYNSWSSDSRDVNWTGGELFSLLLWFWLTVTTFTALFLKDTVKEDIVIPSECLRGGGGGGLPTWLNLFVVNKTYVSIYFHLSVWVNYNPVYGIRCVFNSFAAASYYQSNTQSIDHLWFRSICFAVRWCPCKLQWKLITWPMSKRAEATVNAVLCNWWGW